MKLLLDQNISSLHIMRKRRDIPSESRLKEMTHYFIIKS